MRTIEDTLGLWVSGLLTTGQVSDWAGSEIARLDQPPPELIDLVMDGPEACLKRAQADFPPRATRLPYVDEFALRAIALDLAADDAVQSFADWASRRCLGGDLKEPLVLFGYQLDHLLCDCQDTDGAAALIRDELPPLLDRCRQMAERYA